MNNSDPSTWTDEQKQASKLAGLAKYGEAKETYREAVAEGAFELCGNKSVRWERAKERLNFLFYKISHILGCVELEGKFLENAKSKCAEDEFTLVKFKIEDAYEFINLCKQQDKTPWIAKWKRKLVAKTIVKFVNFCLLSFDMTVPFSNITDDSDSDDDDDENNNTVESEVKSLKQALAFLSAGRAMFEDDTKYTFKVDSEQTDAPSSFSDKLTYEMIKFLSSVGKETSFDFGVSVGSLVYYGLLFTVFSDEKPHIAGDDGVSFDDDNKVINATFSL
jgi:hypothetical protein